MATGNITVRLVDHVSTPLRFLVLKLWLWHLRENTRALMLRYRAGR